VYIASRDIAFFLRSILLYTSAVQVQISGQYPSMELTSPLDQLQLPKSAEIYFIMTKCITVFLDVF